MRVAKNPMFALGLSLVIWRGPAFGGVPAEGLGPPWTGELAWASNPLWHEMPHSNALNADDTRPWWEQMNEPLNLNAHSLSPGTMRLHGAAHFSILAHRLLPGWTAAESGVDNVYTFTPGRTDPQAWKAQAGQNFFFDLGARPNPRLSADVGAEAVGAYDHRFWWPIGDEHRLHNSGQRLRIVRTEGTYKTDRFTLRGFQGVSYFEWAYENDLFHLLPSQDFVERYRRLSGNAVPRGGELDIKTGLGHAKILGGSEIHWRYGPSVYAKYDFPKLGSWEHAIVFKNEEISFGDPGERQWSISENSSFVLSDNFPAHLGLLYQPFRRGRFYQDVDEVPAGQGVAGSQFQVRQERTLQQDAFAALFKAAWRPNTLVEEIGAGYSYYGLLAGNKHEMTTNGSFRLTPDLQTTLAYIYRQPLRGPVPLLFEGTATSPGNLVASPRGPDDPFRVQWDNRKSHLASVTLTFDPTPGTWWYRYLPSILDERNLNPDEDAALSFAVQYRLAYYSTPTDRSYYFDANNKLFYDPVFHAGAFAARRPLNSGTWMVRLIEKPWEAILDVSGGESLAGLSQAYTHETNFYKPETDYVSAGLSVRRGLLRVWGRFGKDVWGPEDFHQQLGWAFHRIYQAGASWDFRSDTRAELRYVGTRMTNDFIGSDTGAFNEIQASLTHRFGAVVDFKGTEAPTGKAVPRDTTPPEVSLEVSTTVFTPDGSTPVTTVTLWPMARDSSGIRDWTLTIRNAQDYLVERIGGKQEPPPTIVWDGKNREGNAHPEGPCTLTLSATDNQDNTAISDPVVVWIRSGPRRDLLEIRQTEEGIRVRLSSQLLFDLNKHELRPESVTALNQLTDLLKAYPRHRLRVEGHADSIGSEEYNRRLSIRRARSVAHYLVRVGGIDRNLIETQGFGKSRPVATNATVTGRAMNRRVEVVILQR